MYRHKALQSLSICLYVNFLSSNPLPSQTIQTIAVETKKDPMGDDKKNLCNIELQITTEMNLWNFLRTLLFV